MAIWHETPTLESIARTVENTIHTALGLVVTGIGEDWLSGTLPVDHRTVQPARILQGGASLVLAEALGSMGASFTVDRSKFRVVGLEINANHIRGVREGQGPVHGVARPLHRGRTTQVWQTEIRDGEHKLVCVSRLTVAVMPIVDAAAGGG